MRATSKALTRIALAGSLLVAACTSDATDSAGGLSSEAVPSTSESTTTTAAPTDTQPETTVVDGEDPADDSGAIGNDGIGDPLFPGLGNGGYDVQNYSLAIDVDRPNITATATITIEADEPLDRFNFDLVGLDVTEVSVDGEPTAFEHIGRELSLDPASVIEPGEPVIVVIDYGGVPEPIADPAGPAELGWYTTDTGTFVVSEPIGAASWFPANDHPLDKATFDIAITVPTDEIAAAAGLLDSTSDNGDGTTTWTWSMSDPMATYLASVVTGSFAFVEEAPIGDTEIRHLFPSNDADRLAEIAERQRPMMELFEDRFGPYPFASYGIVVVDADLGFVALENQTLSIFDASLFITGVPGSFVDRVMAHELAHQWFGDSVSPATWGDIWLNEGFATWGENYWVEQSGSDPWTDVPYNLGPLDDLESDQLFGENVYTRGGYALEALRRTVGDDTFFQILQTWVTRFGGGVASTADFVDLVEELGGSEAAAVIESWISDATMPDLPAR